MDLLGIEFLNWFQCYGLHVLHGNFHVPFSSRIFNIFSLTVTGYMDISMDPFGIEFLN